MKTFIKKFANMSIVGLVILLSGVGLFSNPNIVSADSAVPQCNSATLYGTVTTNGSTTSVWFEWGPTQSMPYSTPIQNISTDGTFSQTLSPLPENTTFYFRSMARNAFGAATGSTLSFTTPSCGNTPPPPTGNKPVVNLSVDQSSVNAGNGTTVRWNPSNSPTSCTASGDWSGSKSTTGGSFSTGGLSNNSSYTMTCTNSAGSSTETVNVQVTQTTPPPPPNGNPPGTNTGNSSPACNSATLYGSVSPNGNATDVWFEWGATPSLAYTTPIQRFSSNTSFSQVLSPLSENTTFYFRAMARNSYGTATGSTSSFTTSPCNTLPNPPTLTLTSDQYAVNVGGSTILSWNSQNATSCSGTSGVNGWVGNKSTVGSFSTGALYTDTTFAMTCVNQSGQVSKSLTIAVSNGNPGNTNPPTLTLTSDQYAVNVGGSTILSWNSQNATSCSGTSGVNGWVGNKSTVGSFSTGALYTDTTFAMTCVNQSGQVSKSLTIAVSNGNPGNTNPPTLTLTSDQYAVNVGGSTILSWNSQNATSCSGTSGVNGWVGNKSTVGSFSTGALYTDTTFAMTCVNQSGQVSKSLTIAVSNGNPGNTNPPTLTLTSDQYAVNVGGSTILSWNSQNATSCSGTSGVNGWVGNKSTVGSFSTGALYTDTTFAMTCVNQSGQVSKSLTIAVSNGNPGNTNPPTLTLTSDQYAVNVGGSTILSWNSQNATSCSGTSGVNGWVGNKSTVGSFSTGALYTDTTFAMTCVNQSGQVSKSLTIAVSNGNPGNTNPPTLTLTSDQYAVNVGGSTILSWNSQNATSCSGTSGVNGWVGNKSTVGSFSTGALYTDTTFAMTCVNQSGQVSKSLTIAVSNGNPGNTNPPTLTLTSDQYAVNVGGSTILSWNSQNATSCSGTSGVNGWVGNKSTVGSFSTGALYTDTTFAMTCVNQSGQVSKSLTIAVSNGNPGNTNPPTLTLTSDQYAVNVGGSTILSWNSQNATSCSGTSGVNGWVGNKSTVGSFSTGALYTDTTFAMTCVNQSGQVSKSLTIAVSNGNPGNTNPPTLTLTSDQYAVNVGGSTILSWNSQNATSCSGTSGVNGWVGNKSTVGSFSTGALYTDTTFAMTCVNQSGQVSKSITIGATGNQYNNPPTINIYADSSNINSGDATYIRWTSTNATSCTANGGSNGWSGYRSTSGSFYTGNISNAMTYSITCTNSTNSAYGSVTVYTNGNNSGNNSRPDISLDADDSNISYGDSTYIRWDVNDADTCRATGGSNGWSGSKNRYSGNFSTGRLYDDTTYSLSCENNYGTTRRSITVYVDNNNQGNNYQSSPTAVTTGATNISGYGAQLNSLVFNPNNNTNNNSNNYSNNNSYNNSNTNAWFEWGVSSYLGNTTRQGSVGSGNSAVYSDSIYGLSPGIKYYYRAVAESPAGRSYGTIMSFSSNSDVTPVNNNNTVVQRTVYVNNGVGIKSLVTLTIDGGSDFITAGEKRGYHVSWKNDSNQTLRNVVLSVILPKTMTYEYTSDGVFSSEDNTLIFNVKTLAAKETGDMFLMAHANNPLTEQELIVVTADMIYTDQSGVQNDALAYATHRVATDGSVLGANAFGAGFLPSSIFGWLLLLILILLLILLAKYLYEDMNRKRQPVLIDHSNGGHH